MYIVEGPRPEVSDLPNPTDNFIYGYYFELDMSRAVNNW